MNLNKNLQKLGLNEKETNVYLASLRLGLSNITDIVRVSGLKRATTYLIIEELIKKGLIRRIKIDKKLYYDSQKPQILKAKLQEQSRVLDRILPDLKKLVQQQSGRPQIQILEGREGIKQIYEETHQYRELVFWSDIEQIINVLGEELKQELEYQEKHNIKVKDIVSDTTFGRRYARQQNKKNPRHQTKIFKGSTFTNDNLIYGDTLVIFSICEGNLFAIKIISKEITQSYKIFFEKLWKSL